MVCLQRFQISVKGPTLSRQQRAHCTAEHRLTQLRWSLLVAVLATFARSTVLSAPCRLSWAQCGEGLQAQLPAGEVVFRNTGGVVLGSGLSASLATKAVQRAALALERVYDVERGDRLAARVLGVGDRVADHVLQEYLEHAAGLLVDEAADALDAAAARQAPDGWLGDACGALLAGQPR